MYMNDFAYRRAATLAEAAELFAGADSPSFLAGGHTLLPTMKNRLAMPDLLVDLRAIPELGGIRFDGHRLEIGAASTHEDVAASPDVHAAIPALAALAGSIADPQVRRVGTIGGSVANNDPSADYPAALLGLGAEIVTDRRSLGADAFFEGLFTTALEEGEIILRIAFPVPQEAGYAKLCSQASRYAVAGVFAGRSETGVRVAVTGAGSDGAFRWTEAEEALSDCWNPAALEGLRPEPDDMIADLNGDGVYRAHLVAVMARRAVAASGGADIR